jgi:hypothetical protein
MASSDTPRFIPARAAKTSAPAPNTPRFARRPKAIDIMAEFDISSKDMAMIYLSPDYRTGDSNMVLQFIM